MQHIKLRFFLLLIIFIFPINYINARKKRSFKFISQDIIPLVSKKPDFYLINGKDPYSLSQYFLSTLISLLNTEVFIETGTANGDTTIIASKIFNKVHTIELSKYYYDFAKNRFANNNNIFIYFGDSSKILSQLIPKIKGKILFWLDGHYSGAQTAKGDLSCPILGEIDAIKKSNLKNSIILIDDIRLFYESMSAEGYPSINILISKILEINNNYRFILFGDILLCITKENITISPVLRACTISRIYNGENFDINDVLNAELVISNANNIEQNYIYYLFSRFCSEKNSKTVQHYPLWQGLIYLNQKHYQNAINCFNETQERGINHWRINWYKAKAFYNLNWKQHAKDLLKNVIKENPGFKEAIKLLITLK